MRRLAFLLLLFAACGGGSPSDRLEKVRSWTSALHFIGQSWVANRVPEKYLIDSANAAADALEKEQQPAAAESARRIERAARNHDRLGVARELPRLALLSNTMRAKP